MVNGSKLIGEPEAKINPQGSGNIFMDYINIGANGFAQVGDDEYYQKNIVEMKILLNYLETKFPVPEKFSSIAFYTQKSFMHDFGSYSEIVLVYNDNVVDALECSVNEEEMKLYDEFWEWVSSVESVDLESDELTQEIIDKYIVALKKKQSKMRVKWAEPA